MKTPAEVIDEAVRRIVDEAHPVQVVVFGSAVRGDFGPDSDLDLLVVMPDGTDRLETGYRLHRRLRRLGCAKDIVVVLESEVEALRDNPSLIIHTALTEGREVYHAA
jgi:predicted nucleotidyltransferase